MASKNTVKVLIDGKIITLSGYESEEYLQRVASYLNNKLTELGSLPGYNRQPPDTRSTLLALKHDLIAAQIQIDKMKQEMEQLQKDKSELSLQVEKLNTELEDLLK